MNEIMLYETTDINPKFVAKVTAAKSHEIDQISDRLSSALSKELGLEEYQAICDIVKSRSPSEIFMRSSESNAGEPENLREKSDIIKAIKEKDDNENLYGSRPSRDHNKRSFNEEDKHCDRSGGMCIMTTTEDLHFLMEIIGHSGIVEGRKRLQKTVCVLKHRDGIPLGFDFVPYYYGPYSETLAGTIQSLVGAGYVYEEPVEIGVGIFKYKYSLTEQGKQEIRQVETRGDISGVSVGDMQNKIAEIDKMKLDDLVRLSKTLELGQGQ